VRIGRALITTVAAAAVVGAASAAAIGFGGGPARTPTSSARPPSTAPITRTTLYDREKHDGTLGHGTEKEVSGRLGGTVTWLPDTGAVVQRGQALYRVDDKPVLLLYGALPAYRELRSGSEGADVRQLETELRALGYTGFTVDDEYTSSTAAAVEKWQKASGLTETGVVELGRVVYAAGPVRVASVSASIGDAAQGALLTVSGTSRVVTVELEVSDQRLAVKGATVTVELPNGKSAQGTISAVTTVVEPAKGDSEATTKIEVTVSLPEADQASITGFDQATVDVTFTAAERKNVLTVPVAALLALAEGGYGVQVVENGASRIVRVETGLFSGGRVEISGDGLAEGMTVGMPS
jgi:peptidoglycan hydrolase-like protein with peptidoglycan-binding domain